MGHTRKTVSGAVGPFKTTKRNIRKVSKLDRWIKHAQTSLKARWRIYVNLGLKQFRKNEKYVLGTFFSFSVFEGVNTLKIFSWG